MPQVLLFAEIIANQRVPMRVLGRGQVMSVRHAFVRYCAMRLMRRIPMGEIPPPS